MALLSETIAPLLPSLRRFARALTGSQQEGDHAVQAMLESLLKDGTPLAQDNELKINLYRLLLSACRLRPAAEGAARGTQKGPMAGAEDHIEAITPRPRIAFLLRSLEDFSREQVGRIMGCKPSDVDLLIAEAGREMAQHLRTDVLIIEDEPFIALDLQSLVEDLGHRVVDIARTHAEAIAAIEDFKPGLILADIQLADGSSGLEAVHEILLSHAVPIIFITAYPERFLTGQRPEPAFLIPKPFSAETVKAVMSQALFFQPLCAAHPSHNTASVKAALASRSQARRLQQVKRRTCLD